MENKRWRGGEQWFERERESGLREVWFFVGLRGMERRGRGRGRYRGTRKKRKKRIRIKKKEKKKGKVIRSYEMK